MFVIHAVRNGNDQILLSEKEFSEILQKLRQLQPVKVIETQAEVIETQEDRQAYLKAMEELAQGETLDFDNLKLSWLAGESANV
jgi:hypothetical protein